MARQKLDPRHLSVTTDVVWANPTQAGHKLVVTYGFDGTKGHPGKIREAFCASFRATADICALANDACILFSRLLQHGDNLHEIADSLGENRAEGASHGPPASLVGAIARKAVEIEREVLGGTDTHDEALPQSN